MDGGWGGEEERREGVMAWQDERKDGGRGGDVKASS